MQRGRGVMATGPRGRNGFMLERPRQQMSTRGRGPRRPGRAQSLVWASMQVVRPGNEVMGFRKEEPNGPWAHKKNKNTVKITIDK